MAFAPIHYLVAKTVVDSPRAAIAIGYAAIFTGSTVAVFVVGNGHHSAIFLDDGCVWTRSVKNLTVVIHAGDAGHSCPESTTFRGKTDMLGSIPAATGNAHALKVFNIGFSSCGDFCKLRVHIAVIAELAMGDGSTVTIINTAFPTDATIAVPPSIVVAGCFVNVVSYDIDDNLDTVLGSFGAKSLKFLT